MQRASRPKARGKKTPVNGRPTTGTALSPAERQRRYRERQKALLADVTRKPLRDEKAEARLAELDRENDALAIKAARLEREIQAKDATVARLTKRLDELALDLAYLREHVATWRTDEGRETEEAPSRPKVRAKAAK